MVKNYIKKPLPVEAIQWDETGETYDEIRKWGAPIRYAELHSINNWDLIIETLEDGPKNQVPHYVVKGDFIVKGIDGEFYPVKPDIFAKTFEEKI